MSVLKLKFRYGLFSISYGMLLAVFLNIGSDVQAIFINGVLGDALSLYEAMCPKGFSIGTSFFEWIKEFRWWQIPGSLLVAFFSLKYIKIRPIYGALCVGIFISASVVDAIFCGINFTTKSELLESILSNALGAPILALLIVGIIVLNGVISEHISLNKSLSQSLLPILLAGFLVIFQFMFNKNFFWVTKSSFSATASAPFYGYYTSTDTDKGFGFFVQDNQKIDSFAWVGKYKNMALNIVDPDNKAQIKLYLLAGCYQNNWKEMISKLTAPNFLLNDVSNLDFRVNDGFGNMSIYSDTGISGQWIMPAKGFTLFSVTTENKDKTLSINLISPEGERELIHEKWNGQVWYRFDVVTVTPNEKSVAREFFLHADTIDVSYKLTLDEASKIGRDMFKCTQVSTKAGVSLVKGLQVTALLSVAYPTPKTINDLHKQSRTIVKGLSGWFSANKVPPDKLGEYVRGGEVNSLSVVGSFDELFVNNITQEKRKQQWLALDGGSIKSSINGEFFTFSGESPVVSIDDNRISKTRWEHLSSSWKWLILLIPASIGFLIRYLFQVWKNNKEILEV